MKTSRRSYNLLTSWGTRYRQAEYCYARTGEPTVFLHGYEPQLGNPAKHKDAQSRHIPARKRVNALPILSPTALLAPYQV